MILGALRTGPKTASQLVQVFRDQRPEISLDVVRMRVWRAVYKMGRAGVTVKDEKAWRPAARNVA